MVAGAGRRRGEALRTVEDVLMEVEAREDPTVGTAADAVFLDLRGPQARVVKHAGELGADPVHPGAHDPTPFPEVQHGLKLALDLFEADLRRLGQQLRREEETTETQERTLKQIGEASTAVEDRMRRAAHFRQRLASCEEVGSAMQEVTLRDLASAYVDLQHDFPAEYASFKCSHIALDICGRRFMETMAGWDPFLQHEPEGQGSERVESPAFSSTGLLELAAWQPSLDTLSAREELDDVYPEEDADSDPYIQLVFSVFIPPLRRSVLAWEPFRPEAFVGFMENWGRVLPVQAVGYIYGHLLLPKLKRALETWSPRAGAPLQLWLHPWLPLAGEHLREIFPDVRHRLGTALRKWLPVEPDAGIGLVRPWKGVLDNQDWESLLTRAVMPRLAELLGSLSHSSPDAAVSEDDGRRLDPVLAWVGTAPSHVMVSLFTDYFFPKWRDAYRRMLKHTLARAGEGGQLTGTQEVAQWYSDWKASFPEELLAAEAVRAEFNQLLVMMNHTAGGASLPEALQSEPEPEVKPPVSRAQRYGQSHLTLKDLVAGYAADMGLEFLPKGRDNDGRQVYMFGKVSITLDSGKELIYASLGGGKEPVTLSRLMQENGEG